MKKILVTMAALAALLAGCKSDPEIAGAPIEDLNAKPGVSTDNRGVQTNNLSGDPLNDPRHPQYQQLQARSIFFDYNSDAIKAEFVGVVEAHARYLVANPNRKVLVQGNADDRGSREYNLALGQRRADAIASRLTLLGVKPAQAEAVSLGEEKPRCVDASESCYAENRRGDLVY